MAPVFVASDNIITSLGFNAAENIRNIKDNVSGVLLNTNPLLHPDPIFLSVVDSERLNTTVAKLSEEKQYTRFEKLLLASISQASVKCSIDLSSPRTIFIISTTKGNIDLLESRNKDLFEPERIHIWKAAAEVSRFFKNPNKPLVISNACISGVLAVITGVDLITSGRYDNAVVAGADMLSEFVVAGFQSFKSLSFGPCKPFDAARDGLSLGEGAGTLILTSDAGHVQDTQKICACGGASSNDSNHISGPSRTGEGLFIAVQKAMAATNTTPENLDYISAHGTATPFNDEMEAKAFNLAGLGNVPLNSFKGYFGHTLGAAGVIETVLGVHSMRSNVLFNTLGFNELGVPDPVNVIKGLKNRTVNKILKTASGFGGCNAALILCKTE